MVTVNEKLLSYSIHAQINNTRFGNNLAYDIISLLNDASAELVDKIRKRGEKGAWTTARLQSLVDAVQKLNSEAYASAFNELQTPLLDFGQHEAETTSDVLQKSLPIKWDVVTPNMEQIKAMVSDAPMQGRLLSEWWASLEASMATKVTQQIRLGVVQGESIDKIVRRLTGSARDYESGIFSIVRRETEVVVRSAVMHVSNQAAAAAYKANADLVKAMLRLETLDARTCIFCQQRDHTEVPVGSSDIAPFHPGCRGFTAPVLKSWKELGLDAKEFPEGTRASMSGQVPERTTYGDWIKGQNFETQKEALGVTRAKLLRDGKLEVKDFVDNKGIVYDLKELKQRQAAAFEAAFGA